MESTEIPAASDPATTPMSKEQREQFDRDGYLVIPNALSAEEVAHYTEVIDHLYADQQAADKLSPEGAMHVLSAVYRAPETAPLLDHPKTFPLVWSILGWNVHVYHSHLDVHPPIRVPKPYRFEWHQDGGRQNREIETDPRPRLSVKLAYWLSDVSVEGRGNFKVVPGSHLRNWIDGPPRRDVEWPEPEGAVEVCANPGDAVFFDRRLWHTRTNNYSDVTRKALFFAYTLRWIAIRDEVSEVQSRADFASYSPVQRQLLGESLHQPRPGHTYGDHQWGHYPETTPLAGFIKDNDLFDQSWPPLKP